MAGSVIRLMKMRGCTDQQDNQRSAGGRIRVGVPMGRSFLGVDLSLGFCKRPGNESERVGPAER